LKKFGIGGTVLKTDEFNSVHSGPCM